jgi:hypothetical protein
MTLTPEQRAKLVARINELASEIADLEEARDNYKATLAADLGLTEKSEIIGTEETGYNEVDVYRSKKFDSAYLKKQNPQAWDKAATAVLTVTSAHAKEVLTPAEYAQGQKVSDKISVVIRPLND